MKMPDEAFDITTRKVRVWIVSIGKMVCDMKLNGSYFPMDGVVMLPSGRIDINGREIYELDKISFARAYHKDAPYDDVVRIVNGCFSVDGVPLHGDHLAVVEIIGNVFEGRK